MRIITCTNMNASVPSVIDPAMLMHLFQLTDSACPVGTFSFSNGLESAAAEGLVYDAATLEAFVGEVVRLSAFTDGVAALHALRSRSAEDEAGIFEADRRLLLCKLNDEARQMTCRMGRKLAELAAALVGDPLLARWLEAAVRRETPGSFPVAQGVAFAAIGADERTLFCAGQYGAANTVLGAALRCVRVTTTTRSAYSTVWAGAPRRSTARRRSWGSTTCMPSRPRSTSWLRSTRRARSGCS